MNRFCMHEGIIYIVTYTERNGRIRVISSRRAERHEQRTSTTAERDRLGMTPDDWKRLNEMTDDEIVAAALSDPDARPIPPERLAKARRGALAKVVRHKLRMGRESFSETYGIPMETLRAWERHEAEPTPAETAYLKLIEREPEMAKLVPAKNEETIS